MTMTLLYLDSFPNTLAWVQREIASNWLSILLMANNVIMYIMTLSPKKYTKTVSKSK